MAKMTDMSCVFSTVGKGHDGNDPNVMIMREGYNLLALLS